MTDSNPHRPLTLVSKFNDLLARFLERPRLAMRVFVIGMVLTAPCLFLGFYLDDYIVRYIYSNLEGAEKLYRIYSGLYGLATGNPAENHWQIEAGHAPWWTAPNLRLFSFRPVSLVTHFIDARVGLNNALLMHAHSYLWFALLIPAAILVFRGMLGPLVGGLAALLFTIDHTHGVIIGYICNRHALVTAVFGLLCLHQHHRWRRSEHKKHNATHAALAWILYAVTLLAGDSGLAIGGYLLAYAAFSEEGPRRNRALSFVPYLLITLVWRAVVAWLGCGAQGSGIYIDPTQDPLRFVPIFIERLPILLLGQFLLPPAELSPIYQPWQSYVVWSLGVIFLISLCVALAPLIKQNKTARFWAAGYVLSLLPASLTAPHSRQLLLSSVGAVALISQLWYFHYVNLSGPSASPTLLVSRSIIALTLLVHLIFSPVALPFTTCSIAVAAPMHQAADALGANIAGRDVIFVTVPDFFAVRLAQLRKRIDHQPLPRRWRTLSAGPEQVTVHRTGLRTLVLDYQGGMLKGPLTTLFRDSGLRMAVGERNSLQGLDITILAVTDDGRARRVEFSFDESVDSPQLLFYYWAKGGFTPFTPPPVSRSIVLPMALLELL